MHILYRAQDVDLTSRLGYSTSKDGLKCDRFDEPVFFPSEDANKKWEWPGGTEDPRIVEGPNFFVMTYTAYDGITARLSVATSTDLKNWTKHGLAFAKAQNGKFIDTWSKSGSIVTQLQYGKIVAKMINNKYWMYWGESNIFMATSTNLIDWEPLEHENKL